jgi:hypothetical protein
MQIRVIKHVRKVYACRGCETAPVTADKPAQLIEKSMASPSVLYVIHKPHLLQDGVLVYLGISGEQFHGSSAS